MPLLSAGMILLFGSSVQGAIGFGLGMIAIPLLIDAGFSLSQAVALATVLIGIQALFGAYQLRPHIPWSDIKPAAIVRFLTVPLGVLLLLSVESLNTAEVKRLVGAGVLLGVIVRGFAKQEAHRQLPKALSTAAFALSGILQGLVAMGGPPLVLWMTTRNFRAKQARAFIMTLFLLNAPLQVMLLLFWSETMNLDVIPMALLLSPLIFIGTTAGVRVGNRFSKLMLNRAALVILLLIALNAVF